MFSLFNRKKKAPPEVTFKTRVQQFWTWYAEIAPQFYQTIETGKCSELAPEISAKVDELVPGLAWVFGPGEDGKGHSLTLSGEGNLHRQLLTQYWRAQAPTLPGWTFYESHQPCSIRGQRIDMHGRKFDPIEFWITPSINSDDEKVDMTIWHPLFDIMQERERWSVLFIFLDRVLGEYGTQQWIGEIKLESKRLSDSIPLEELNDFLKQVQTAHQWRKLPPGESATAYHMKAPSDKFLRGDIIAGTTMHINLVNEYLKTEGSLKDPLAGTGADYVFVAFDNSILPKGNQAHARGEIEDALDAALRSSANGRLLGGAHGTEKAYIDLLLLDGQASTEIVINVLRERKLPAGTSINYFAQEKRGYRRVI